VSESLNVTVDDEIELLVEQKISAEQPERQIDSQANYDETIGPIRRLKSQKKRPKRSFFGRVSI
jgi:hypothetical protein